MSDDQTPDQNNAAPDAMPDTIPDEAFVASNLPVMIMAQYIKDLSFENPYAPEILAREDMRPVMDASFAMDARRVEWQGRAEIYEVSLGLQCAAKKGDKVAFMCEVQYGILVDMSRVPEDQRHPMLLIEMPRYAFPFVRQIVADLTQQAGYMPLLLAPADFRKFYMQRYGEDIRRSRGAA